MVIIFNMENGELIAMQGSADNAKRNEHAVLGCPAAQPFPLVDERRYVMPALMEHDFTSSC